MLFPNLSTTLPWPMVTIAFKVIGFLGALLMIYAIYLEEEKHQDLIFVVGSSALLIYSISISNRIFTFLSIGMLMVAGREFIQIIRKKHFHSTGEIENYKNPK